MMTDVNDPDSAPKSNVDSVHVEPIDHWTESHSLIHAGIWPADS